MKQPIQPIQTREPSPAEKAAREALRQSVARSHTAKLAQIVVVRLPRA